MGSKKLIVKVMTGLIAAGVTLSVGISASAKSNDAAASNKNLAITQGKVDNKRVICDGNIKAQLESLVEAGTITKEQSDKITEFINQKNEERKAEMEKVNSMNAEERKAYFKSQNDAEKTDMLKELVDNKIINQEQADKLKASLSEKIGRGEGIDYKIKNNCENLKTTLDTLVESGKITQAQEDKIISFMNEKRELKKAEMEKVKNMTEDERKTYFENQKSVEKNDMFKELVDNGTLTQTEADVIKDALPKMEKVKDKKAGAATNKATTINKSTN